MKQQIGPMMPKWIRPPKNMVKPERHPRQRLILAKMKGREHPLDFGPAEASIADVTDECTFVPVYQAILQHRDKRPHCDQDDQGDRQKMPSLPR